MKNEQNEEEEVSEKEEPKSEVTPLPRMEMYAVLGLELGKKIFEKLEEVENSVEMLAAQKARELEPKPPKKKTK